MPEIKDGSNSAAGHHAGVAAELKGSFVVPEPSCAALLALGLLALYMRRAAN